MNKFLQFLLDKRVGELILIISINAFSTVYAAATPDGITLLQGVESVRLQIPPSSLKVQYSNRDAFINNQSVLTVDFDGDKRRFLTVPGETRENHSIYNGTNAIVYDPGNYQIEYRNIGDANLMLLFDPRLLGISPYFQWRDSMENLIPYKTAKKVEVIGRELVGTNQTWHVKVTMIPPAFDADFWIDDSDNFKVYRHDLNHVETYSYYENSSYPWLPSRVESKEYNGNHDLTDERICLISEAKANVKFNDNTWSISGLKVPPGPRLLDVSTGKWLGYWDGSKLGQTPPVNMQVKTVQNSRFKWFLFAVSFTILSIPLVIFYVRSTNKSK